MKKYKVNTDYIDKATMKKVEKGSTVTLSDDRYKEITTVLGEEALAEVKAKTKKEDKE